MDTETPGLSVEQLSVRRENRLILDNISIHLAPGHHLAVVGQTGSGKTTLIQALAGQIFHQGTVSFSSPQSLHPRIQVISRQHRFTNLSNISSFYYQQRFNSFDAEDALTVRDELSQSGATATRIQEVLGRVGMEQLGETRLIQLSNGEHKRFQLAQALLTGADWLLFDCPYIGLDVKARKMLNDILDELVHNGQRVLLVTGRADMPACITHVAILEAGKLGKLMTRKEYDSRASGLPGISHELPEPHTLQDIPTAYEFEDFSIAVKMVDTSIRYDQRTILDRINWEVRKGECWNLAGPNGSGKSTLLSLINGDNPQAFANEIILFDRPKGSGESIWDIKRKIGYVSPELHHYFDAGSTCFDLVASGLFDTMGLFRRLSEEQNRLINQWMDLLHIAPLAEKLFQRLSDGEQRRVLLARALVKNPPMLILDEPCQGLDDEETAFFKKLVDSICTALGKTLIYVSHYETELPSCITKRIVLEEGRVKEMGPR